MSKIDPIRLTEIFRTLSSSSKPTSNPKTVDRAGVGQAAPKKSRHDKAQLRLSLSQRLKKIKKSSDDFDRDAPIVTIQEILLWEFGEEILSDPNYKVITGSISMTLQDHPVLKEHLVKLTQELLKE